MGKKPSITKTSSSRICKNEKKQFNSLIEVLRPKVYITNVSNFKTLVQELTGNNTSLSSSSSSITNTVSSLPCSRLQVIEQIPVSICESEDNDESIFANMSLDTSFDSLNSLINEEIPTTFSTLPYSSSITTVVSSLPYSKSQVSEQIMSLDNMSMNSFNSWNKEVNLRGEIDQSWNQIYEDVTTFDSSMKQQMDFPTAEEMEMLLLDMESTWFDNDLPKIEEEVNNMWLI
ncbi:hypothetical protein M5689_025194 [Euphorbia peplus]|nr:hypothetical protein M5689_025194 [Euphorbia peplus]